MSVYSFKYLQKTLCRVIPLSLENVLEDRKFIADLFFRCLAFIYFVAFASIIWQFQLISERGVIPFKEFVEITWLHEGMRALLVYPSIFWIQQADWFTLTIMILACVSAFYSIFFKAQTILFLFLWIVYLSTVNFGRDLFHLPWDTFLLEIGFLSVLAVYFVNKVNWLPRILLFAFLLLFFRQWFSMGLVKILWGADAAWYDLSFMKYYWLHQPSPTIFAWKMYNLPMLFHKIFTAVTLLFEVLIPVSMFLGRRGRIFAFASSLLLSILIQINGNFGFFNALTAILGIWCLDDVLLGKRGKMFSNYSLRMISPLQGILITVIFSAVGLNLFYCGLQFTKEANHPMNIVNYYFSEDKTLPGTGIFGQVFLDIGKVFSRFRIVSPHGVFKSIAKERQQIQIHVKTKDRDWQPVQFRKGHDLDHFYFISPFMNHLPLKFSAHWAHRTDFSFYLKIHPNTEYLPSYKVNIIRGLFANNEEIFKLIGYEFKGEVEAIRVYRMRLHVHQDTKYPFKYNDPENEVLDSAYFYSPELIDFSVFDNDPRRQNNQK